MGRSLWEEREFCCWKAGGKRDLRETGRSNERGKGKRELNEILKNGEELGCEGGEKGMVG